MEVTLILRSRKCEAQRVTLTPQQVAWLRERDEILRPVVEWNLKVQSKQVTVEDRPPEPPSEAQKERATWLSDRLHATLHAHVPEDMELVDFTWDTDDYATAAGLGRGTAPNARADGTADSENRPHANAGGDVLPSEDLDPRFPAVFG